MTTTSYALPWGIYLLAACVFCVLWWRLSRGIGNLVLRWLLRGLALVLIFTPWFVGDNQEHFAPALLVLVFELFIVDTEHGFRSILALGGSTAIMLIVLSAWALLRTRKRDQGR